MADGDLLALVTSIVLFGAGGFFLSRKLSKTYRTTVDNAAVLAMGLFAAMLLCFVVNIGWPLDWSTAAPIAFGYCFFWDRGRMIRDWFPERMRR